MLKKAILLTVAVLTGCGMLPTPDDFPSPPPMTVIVEIPPVTATVTLEPHLRPILADDLQDAETTFLIVKTALAAGDDKKVAELVKYPLRVNLNGQEMMLKDQQEFLDQYGQIFDQDFVTTLFDMDEEKLTLFPNGVQVGNGEVWLNYFCTDLTCTDAQFLITQINK